VIMTATNRRPVVPDVPLDARFPKALIVELAFPTDLGVVDRILDGYLSEQRRPAHAYFLLDVSGSMKGTRLAKLQEALNTLAGDDSSITGRFARFQPRERVSLLTFSDSLHDRRDFDLGTPAQAPATRAQIKQTASGLQAAGGTALFSSLQATYQAALEARKTEPDRYFSIVVMTDGENNQGASLAEFRQFYESLPAGDRTIKVFPIAFGEASREDLKTIADLTGGRVFDGNSAALAAVFKEIRGYQ
jgi:Ca-activated chloride channel family protein